MLADLQKFLFNRNQPGFVAAAVLIPAGATPGAVISTRARMITNYVMFDLPADKSHFVTSPMKINKTKRDT